MTTAERDRLIQRWLDAAQEMNTGRELPKLSNGQPMHEAWLRGRPDEQLVRIVAEQERDLQDWRTGTGIFSSRLANRQPGTSTVRAPQPVQTTRASVEGDKTLTGTQLKRVIGGLQTRAGAKLSAETISELNSVIERLQDGVLADQDIISTLQALVDSVKKDDAAGVEEERTVTATGTRVHLRRRQPGEVRYLPADDEIVVTPAAVKDGEYSDREYLPV